MSPDVLQGFTVGLHDDIYSFGITMWQLKTNTDPYYNISSNDFVAYHVVKNSLRPDSQLQCQKLNENFADVSGLDSLNGESSGHNKITIRRSYRLLTPNIKRKPIEYKFLSAGHTKKHCRITTFTSSKVIKKLDFNVIPSNNKIRSPLTLRSVNLNVPVITKIKNNVSVPISERFHKIKSALDKENYVNFFKDTCQNLSMEKIIEIESAYSNLYKKCWKQEAVKRPSSQVVFDLLQSILNLFD